MAKKQLRMTYVCFVQGPPVSVTAVTKQWLVQTTFGGCLGLVKWHAPWRRYCFYPEAETLYDALCLQEIAKFCDDETQKRKEERRQEQLTAEEKQHEDNAAYIERMLNMISP